MLSSRKCNVTNHGFALMKKFISTNCLMKNFKIKLSQLGFNTATNNFHELYMSHSVSPSICNVSNQKCLCVKWASCVKFDFLFSMVHLFKRSESYIFWTFFKLLEILVSQESSYFFTAMANFTAEKHSVWEDINENVPVYGNHFLLL